MMGLDKESKQRIQQQNAKRKPAGSDPAGFHSCWLRSSVPVQPLADVMTDYARYDREKESDGQFQQQIATPFLPMEPRRSMDGAEK
jgi:hypothetical protein